MPEDASTSADDRTFREQRAFTRAAGAHDDGGRCDLRRARLLSDEEIDILTAAFDRVLANLDRGSGSEGGPGRDDLHARQKKR